MDVSLPQNAQLLQAVFGVAGAPVVMALVSVLVKPFVTDSRFYPVAAVAIGVVWNGLLALVLGLPLSVAALLGVLTGLGAAGVYSGAQTFGARAAQP